MMVGPQPQRLHSMAVSLVIKIWTLVSYIGFMVFNFWNDFIAIMISFIFLSSPCRLLCSFWLIFSAISLNLFLKELLSDLFYYQD